MTERRAIRRGGMPDTQYVALLRGINVGGGNIIRMADLKACFEAQKLKNVATYIQSGNVLFEAAPADPARMATKIEKALATTFSPYKARVVLCSHARLDEIVRRAPGGFGSQPAKYRYDVMFLKEPLTASEAIKTIPTKEGVDNVFAGPGALYFSRLIAKATQSRLSRVVSLPIYQHMTIRNWNTTTKLLGLMEERSGA